VDPLPPSFETTRAAAHRLAEHVLCTARYATVGRVGLTPVGDGIATPPFEGRVVGLRGVELVDAGTGGERRSAVTTLRSAGEFFDVVPGAPPLWVATTNGDLDAVLDIAPDAVAALATWFTLVATALTATHPAAPQTLWPEHFDLATTVGEATYGGSPGDDDHAEPYLYVIPPSPVPDGDVGFWGEPFGASLSYSRIAGVADAVAFFEEAQVRVGASSPELAP
jgi:hypothetical protein